MSPSKSKVMKAKSLSRSEGYLHYSWKRSESFSNEVKLATDLSYKNTYGKSMLCTCTC